MTTSRTIVFTGQGYNLTSRGTPNPDDPMSYWDDKRGKVPVILKNVRCKIIQLYDNGYAVIESNRSSARYGVKVGRLRK